MSIAAGASVDRPITPRRLTARRLRRDPALFLEVECEGDETLSSGELEIKDIRTWTPEDEVKAALGVLVVGTAWWLMLGVFSSLPRAVLIVVWALIASLCAWQCSEFYSQLCAVNPRWGRA